MVGSGTGPERDAPVLRLGGGPPTQTHFKAARTRGRVRRALLVPDTPLPPDDVLRPLLARADRIVGVDGGTDRALARGIEPDVVVGDMDSIVPETLARFPKSRAHRLEDIETTDIEKAVQYVRRARFGAATIVCSSSGRLDHTLGMLAVLHKYRDELDLTLVDEDFTIRQVRHAATFRAPKGTMVSLVTLDGAERVTTRGLRWPLKDADLPVGTRGIHNEVVSSPASVRLRSGHLFLMVAHYVLPHR